MGLWKIEVAERVGFEPTVQLPVLRFSRPVLSSTQPSLREWEGEGVDAPVPLACADSIGSRGDAPAGSLIGVYYPV